MIKFINALFSNKTGEFRNTHNLLIWAVEKNISKNGNQEKLAVTGEIFEKPVFKILKSVDSTSIKITLPPSL